MWSEVYELVASRTNRINIHWHIVLLHFRKKHEWEPLCMFVDPMNTIIVSEIISDVDLCIRPTDRPTDHQCGVHTFPAPPSIETWEKVCQSETEQSLRFKSSLDGDLLVAMLESNGICSGAIWAEASIYHVSVYHVHNSIIDEDFDYITCISCKRQFVFSSQFYNRDSFAQQPMCPSLGSHEDQ